MKNEENFKKAISLLVDSKYKETSQKLKSLLKDKICNLANQEMVKGKNLTIQIFDKNAKSQKVSYMNREQHFFTILNIDI